MWEHSNNRNKVREQETNLSKMKTTRENTYNQNAPRSTNKKYMRQIRRRNEERGLERATGESRKTRQMRTWLAKKNAQNDINNKKVEIVSRFDVN